MDLNQEEAVRMHVARDNLGSLQSQSKLESQTPSRVERMFIDLKIDRERGIAYLYYT